MKRLSALATLAALSLGLTSCSAAPDPLADVLERPYSSEDQLPGELLEQAGIPPESERLVGVDSMDYEYWVGPGEQGSACLLVRAPKIDYWGSACGPPGQFTLEFSGTRVWLSAENWMGETADEVLADVVHISRS